MKKHIVVLNQTSNVGGAEVVLMPLLKHLNQDKNLEITLVLGDDGYLSQWALINRIKVLVIPLPHVLKNMRRGVFNYNPYQLLKAFVMFLSYVLQIRKFLKINNCSIVITNSFKAHFYGALSTLGMGISLIWRVHDIIDDRSFSKAAVKLFSCFANKFPCKIIAVSKSSADAMVNNGVSGNIVEIVFNGIDLDKFKIKNISLKYEKLSVVGMAGRLIPQSGLDSFISVAVDILNNHSNIQFVILGETSSVHESYLTATKKSVEHLISSNKIVFTGFVENPIEYIKQMDVFVFPSSLPSALPTVILEAMSVGTPVVAFDVDAANEIITSGHNGIIVPNNDLHKMRKAIVELVSESEYRMEIATNARKTVETRFCINKYLTNMKKLIV